MPQQRLDPPHGTLDADRQHPVQDGIVDGLDRIVADQHGVIDHPIDPADAGGCLTERDAVRDIDDMRGDRSRGLAQLDQRRGVHIERRNPGARLCGAEGQCPTKPRPAPVIRMDLPERSNGSPSSPLAP